MPRKIGFDFDRDFFSRVPSSIIQRGTGEGEEGLNAKELSVWSYINSHTSGYELGIKEIADRFGRSREWVRKVVVSLEEKGVLYRDRREYKQNRGSEFILAPSPNIMASWLASEGLLEDENEKSEAETTKTDEPDSPQTKSSPDREDREPNRNQAPDRTEERTPEPNFTSSSHDLPSISPSLTEHLSTQIDLDFGTLVLPGSPITDGHPVFTDPPFLPDRHPIRHTLPFDWQDKIDRDLSAFVYSVEEGTPLPTIVGGGTGFSAFSGHSAPNYAWGPLPTMLGGRSQLYLGAHTITIKDYDQGLRSIVSLLPKERLSNVRRQRARAGVSHSAGNLARKKRLGADLDRSRNRWLGVFGKRERFFYRGVTAFVREESEPQGQSAEDENQHHPEDKSRIQPESLDSDLENGDPVKRAYRAIWIEPFEEETEIPTTPTSFDQKRAEEASLDPKRVMLLRQVAEVKIKPHVFDGENTYESPGRDPWAVRMYCKLAFPDAQMSESQKQFIDDQVSQSLPTSPADWAKVLLHGLEQGWSPDFPENFTKAYRHRMDIERDPNRPPMKHGRRMSATNFAYGNGIDLSEESLDRIAPPQLNEDGTHPGREMSQIHGPDFDAQELSERVDVRGSVFDEDGTLAKNSDPSPQTNDDTDGQSPSE